MVSQILVVHTVTTPPTRFSMMIARFSVLFVCGVLSTVFPVSRSANLRAQKDIASEAADEAALMGILIEEFANERRLIEKFENDRRIDGLEEEVAAEAALITEKNENERDLQFTGWGDVVPCDSGWGDQLPYPFNLNPEIWGTCSTMHPCMCGLDAPKFAYMCPNKCRPSCGGTCAATYSNCPTGFAFDTNGNKRSLETPLAPPDEVLWPWNLGLPCPVYDHSGNYNP